MKIKFEDIEIEATPKEVYSFISLIFDEPKNIETKTKEKLYYGKSLAEIRIGDIVSVLESEFCVTNTDKIIYNETISGMTCRVKDISLKENVVTIVDAKKGGFSFFVHPTWLQLNSRKSK